MGKSQSPCQLGVSNSRFQMHASSCSATAYHLALKGQPIRPLQQFSNTRLTIFATPILLVRAVLDEDVYGEEKDDR